MMKVFLDTNILIDILERREPFFLQSANILELGFRRRLHLYATSLSFINGIYVSRKSIGKETAIEKTKVLRKAIDVSPISSNEFDMSFIILFKSTLDSFNNLFAYELSLSSIFSPH